MTELSKPIESAEAARKLAERIFSQYPQTSKSLIWLKDHKTDFENRITDFESVVAKLNKALTNPDFADKQYQAEISALADLSINHIPSLEEAQTETVNRFTHNSPALRAYFQGKREFGWADEEFDPGKPAKSAMGILLEGYGRYIGLRQTNEPEKAANIQKAFVYAFEAVLLIQYPDSELLGDVKEWMIADSENFSEPIQKLLE